MTDKLIYTMHDVLEMLDKLLQDRQERWWDEFFSDRGKECPFFVEWPDENLVAHFDSAELHPGRALELGCGHGRNALFLARKGCQVDAVDFSEEAIAWAKERAGSAELNVNFMCQSIFDLDIRSREYDIVYDSGCFHHLPPHRRQSYVELVTRALKPTGDFALACFTPEGGSGLTDAEVYQQRKLGGGLGYTDTQLREIFSHAFNIVSLRRMKEMSSDAKLFGKEFLWAMLMKPLPNKAMNADK